MLVTQATLVKVICFVVPVIVIYNFLYLSLVSLPHDEVGFNQSIHQVFRNWKSPTSSSNSTSPNINQSSLYLQNFQQPRLAYVDAPSTLDRFFSSPNPVRKDYHEWNEKTLRDLHACMSLGNCGPNQMKVALLADNWIQDAVVRDFRGGEGIWGMSMYKNLRELGYTTLFSSDFTETLFQYRMMPDLVKVIIRGETGKCHRDKDCVKGPENQSGIPAWKLFEWSYWPNYRLGDSNCPMKGKWLLSANPDYAFTDFDSSPIQYIGYSTEDTCTSIPIVPLEQRKNQVWMLMKQLIYVYHNKFPWNRTYFPLVHEKLGIDFVGGWLLDKDYLGWGKDIQEEMLNIEDHDDGVFNLGMQPANEFLDQVRSSKLMIGMANPHWSPSPIDALCLGVPFLNPISSWKEGDPWNKSHWDTQHPTLVEYDRPYVYHVHAKNFTGFLEAIESAMTTPIGRFIPEHMTENAVKGRLTKLMETDWRAKAEETLKQNMKAVERGEEAYIFEL
ncbi:hypothetical protein D9756_009331 [Leucocoprinus leucothites]|uniref:Glycosyltransferase family 18 catalytic domain-containing protein n=1 Tax=Leucocoprinus leucothites TaxID=201217 RepID=A0A8H5CX58_9AGAR|nr:hypothetical protein D9756_009331 [Leucoagaricus leucothites]